MCDDEVVGSHDLINQTIHISLEPEVTIGDDAHEVHVVVHHRNSSDVVFRHHAERLSHG